MSFRYRFFWTIWSFGYYRIKGFTNQTIQFQLFVGPVVFTWWR